MVDCKIIFLLLALITSIMSQCNNYVSYYEGLDGVGNQPEVLQKKFIVNPNYDIEEELRFFDVNITQKLAEVPQEFTGNDEMPAPPKLPKRDPRDQHLPENQSPEVQFWIQHLLETREHLKQQKYAFIKSNDMIQYLKLFDATDEDLLQLKNSCDNLNHDPYLKSRKVSMYRLGMDLEQGIAHRLVREPFILYPKDGFVRFDSGKLRFYGETQDWVMQNSAFQALIKFKAFMMFKVPSSPRDGMDENRIYNHIGFFARTGVTKNLSGEVAPEGVHQDGQNYVMTILLKSRNVDWNNGSATSKIINMEEGFGKPGSEVNPKNIIDKVQHRNFMDTLFIIDTDVTHAVSDIEAKENSPAFRDMFVAFTRRMRKKTDEDDLSKRFDSERGHSELPFAVALKSKLLINHV